MFCYQCQETAGGKGCTVQGVCGKKADVANLQDLLIYTLKGIALYRNEAKNLNIDTKEADRFIQLSLFTTITNANFDYNYFINRITEAKKLRDDLKNQVKEKDSSINITHDSANWDCPEDKYDEKALDVGVLSTENEDIRSLRELTIYGLKGAAAYGQHAANLNFEDQDIYDFFSEALVATLDDSLSVDELVALVLKTGDYGVKVMALLDKANTETYGNPEPTEVNIGVRNNPAILITGHDLKDMEELLKQTEGTGVDVYTHSEMLPSNSYPAFKKYDHLVGNYGSAWWAQKSEFETFNGPILFTTNCLVPPKDSYKDRIYVTGAVGYEGLKVIKTDENGNKDFSEIIEHAKKCPPPTQIEEGSVMGGFAHNAVLSVADKVIEAVKSGDIKKFFVMGGCDGRMKSRDYYTEFAKALPKDTIILTAGCAKYRYNKLDLGDIGGIPRVLDAGQCNDSYSLAVIAMELQKAFELEDINDLPIEFNIAWYEQKAVIVLLALLALGIKNIHLGPTLPGFLSPNVANVLVENFGIAPITSVEEDIEALV
ncbi:MAG: hydroxylamine reductase [Andreesenia angusta]|nr:hydroxylamine reductase [Andreesenia angusta]